MQDFTVGAPVGSTPNGYSLGVQCKALINAWCTRTFLVNMSFPFLASSFMYPFSCQKMG